MEAGGWSSSTSTGCINTAKIDDCSSSKERESRSIALEKAYVHDVYQQIASHFSDPTRRVWPRVKQFLLDLEPGSVICDVGCGNGKYLDVNPSIYKIGLDRCVNLTNIAREKEHEVLVCDNLTLPFRDECFDAVLSVAVIHHFATMERRIEALKELSRVLRIGGKLMVSVWAMEQRHRKFDSQDVLVPWNKPTLSSSDDKTSSIERDLNSTTTTTSDDDATHYHAYTQTSDSDSFPSLSRECRRRTGKVRHRGRSIDPHYPTSSHSSSDLSSPNESCYSFVRRALQKLAGAKRNRGGRTPWFLQGFEGQDDLDEPFALGNDDNLEDFMPIELRQLESTEFAELLQLQESNRLLFTNALSPRRRRTLETTCGLQKSANNIDVQPKSKSLSDLLSLIPMSLFRGSRNPLEHFRRSAQNSTNSAGFKTSVVVDQQQPSLSEILSPDDLNVQFPDFVRHKAVQTDSFESLEINLSGSSDTKITIKLDSDSNTLSASVEDGIAECVAGCSSSSRDNCSGTRPLLVKQKQSLSSTSFTSYQSSPPNQGVAMTEMSPLLIGNTTDSVMDRNEDQVQQQSTGTGEHQDNSCWKDIQQSVKNLPEFKSNTLRPPDQTLRAGLSSIWKQTSLNEDLIFTERLKEKEKLKQHIQKQCSLNEELIYTQREGTRWDQMKEAFFNHSNVKRIQSLKNNLSNRFRGTDVHTENGSSSTGNTATGGGYGYESISSSNQSTVKQVIQGSSLRNGFVRMLKNWKTTDEKDETDGQNGFGVNSSMLPGGARRGSKEGVQRRGLFPPFFLRRSSVGSLNVGKNDGSVLMSPLTSPPYLKRRPSENELGVDNGNGGGGKLLPGVRHVRKLSREEGSDSSKDSSFQSDTSVDSEDSFASVIFIPRPNSVDNSAPGHENAFFNSETRANSTDSDRSPKSPASKLSPPTYNTPKSPSPLACEFIGRRRSPEVSPTRFGIPVSSPHQEIGVKFAFDEQIKEKYSDQQQQQPSETTQLPVEVQPVAVQSFSIAKSATGVDGAVPSTSKENVNKTKSSKIEKIVVLRKPGTSSESKTVLTKQQVRRSLPKELALELFNPETDDVDTSDTSASSSPNSVSSVVSVLNEDSSGNSALQVAIATVVTESQISVKDACEQTTTTVAATFSEPTPADKSSQQQQMYRQSGMNEPEKQMSLHYESSSSKLPVLIESDNERNEDDQIIAEGEKTEGKAAAAAASKISSSSFDTLISSSSPKTRRKHAMSRFGNTSEWLYSLPSDILTTDQHHSKRAIPSERRTSGEKMLFGEVKKQKGPDAKWPASITDESPGIKSEDEAHQAASSDTASHSSSDSVSAIKNVEEFEEKESLFDSIENLANKQQPSRNPSLDSSVRMSSTCSCSIRGGDSFDSWTSAKSSLTNSSSTHHKSSYPSLITLPVQQSNKAGCSSSERSDRAKRLDPSKTWSSGTEDTEDSALLTYHRYYHVFREGELDKLIEKYVQNLHVISSYYDHANWCIIAEKVQVWTI